MTADAERAVSKRSARRALGGLMRRGRALQASLAAALLVTGCAPVPVVQDPNTERPGFEQAEAPAPLRPLQRYRAVPADAPLSAVIPVVPDPMDAAEDGPPEEIERGGASYYGLRFHGRRTASGERFDMTGFTAAHRTLAFGTRICVRSMVNGRTVMVRITDRGPMARQRVIDLSQAAAEALGMIGLGIKQVVLLRPRSGREDCEL